VLLGAGAAPGARADDGWTAIQAAAMVGESGIVELLRAAGAGD